MLTTHDLFSFLIKRRTKRRRREGEPRPRFVNKEKNKSSRESSLLKVLKRTGRRAEGKPEV